MAEATDCTLAEASSEAAATDVGELLRRARRSSSGCSAEASSSVDADDTVSTISPTAPSNCIGELAHVRLAPLGLPRSVSLLLRAQPLRLDHAVLEHLDRAGHLADLVAATKARDTRP